MSKKSYKEEVVAFTEEGYQENGTEGGTKKSIFSNVIFILSMQLRSSNVANARDSLDETQQANGTITVAV